MYDFGRTHNSRQNAVNKGRFDIRGCPRRGDRGGDMVKCALKTSFVLEKRFEPSRINTPILIWNNAINVFSEPWFLKRLEREQRRKRRHSRPQPPGENNGDAARLTHFLTDHQNSKDQGHPKQYSKYEYAHVLIIPQFWQMQQLCYKNVTVVLQKWTLISISKIKILFN